MVTDYELITLPSVLGKITEWMLLNDSEPELQQTDLFLPQVCENFAPNFVYSVAENRFRVS